MRRTCAAARSSVIKPDARRSGVRPLPDARRFVGKRMAGLSLDLIALQLFAGLALGAIYVLFAIGLSLIFGMLTVVNFAHGAFYMVGAYVGLYILMLGGNFWICLIVVPLAVGLFGLAGRTRPDPAALRPRHRLSAAADVWIELCDGRTGADRLRQDRISRSTRRRFCKAPSISGSAISRSTACS